MNFQQIKKENLSFQGKNGSFYVDVRDCDFDTNFVGQKYKNTVSIISNSVGKYKHSVFLEIENLVKDLNDFIKNNEVEVISQPVEYIGDEGGLKNTDKVIHFSEKERKFFISFVDSIDCCTCSSREQRHYYLIF